MLHSGENNKGLIVNSACDQITSRAILVKFVCQTANRKFTNSRTTRVQCCGVNRRTKGAPFLFFGEKKNDDGPLKMMNSYFEQSGFYGGHGVQTGVGAEQAYRFPLGLGVNPYGATASAGAGGRHGRRRRRLVPEIVRATVQAAAAGHRSQGCRRRRRRRRRQRRLRLHRQWPQRPFRRRPNRRRFQRQRHLVVGGGGGGRRRRQEPAGPGRRQRRLRRRLHDAGAHHFHFFLPLFILFNIFLV